MSSLAETAIRLSMKKYKIVMIACLMISCYLFANAACVPALPSMRSYFLTSTFNLQCVVVIYILALGLSQLVYGPLSDVYGRRKIALIGTCIFALGGGFSLLASSISGLLAARCLQGLGAGCYSVIAKSMTHDVYKNKAYINATLVMMLFTVMTQMLSPVLGGYLVSLFSWRANLIAIFIYCLITLVVLYCCLPETYQGSISYNLQGVTHEYRQILAGFRFWSLLLISALTLGAITLYQMVSPFILQEHLHASSVIYGWSMVISSGGFLIGNSILLAFNHTQAFNTKLAIGIGFMLLGALAMLWFQAYAHIAAVVLPFGLFNIGTGIVFPLTTAGALLEYPTKPGAAGALIGSLQMVLVGLLTLSAAHIHIPNQGALGQALLLIVCLCLLIPLCMCWAQSDFYMERKSEKY